MASRVSGENSVRHTSVATARLAYWHCRSASDVRWSSRRREGCSSGLIAALAYLTAGRSLLPMAPEGAGPPPPRRGRRGGGAPRAPAPRWGVPPPPPPPPRGGGPRPPAAGAAGPLYNHPP